MQFYKLSPQSHSVQAVCWYFTRAVQRRAALRSLEKSQRSMLFTHKRVVPIQVRALAVFRATWLKVQCDRHLVTPTFCHLQPLRMAQLLACSLYQCAFGGGERMLKPTLLGWSGLGMPSSLQPAIGTWSIQHRTGSRCATIPVLVGSIDLIQSPISVASQLPSEVPLFSSVGPCRGHLGDSFAG